VNARTPEYEELANSVTHGIALLASIAATALLLVQAASNGTVWHIVGSAIFGATLVLLYAASTSYHVARTEQLKARLRVLDHSAIYLLIAGTYTPFMLTGLRGGWGWSLFGVVWGLATAGVIFKLFFTGRYNRVSTAIYIFMGWVCVIAAGPMIRRLSPVTLAWLLAGGILYTAGTAFFHSRRLPYAHAVWHVFVMGGSVCHAIAVASQVQ
jgi:hemolysin III